MTTTTTTATRHLCRQMTPVPDPLPGLPIDIPPQIALHHKLRLRDLQALACAGRHWRECTLPLLQSIRTAAFSAINGPGPLRTAIDDIPLPTELATRFTLDYIAASLSKQQVNRKRAPEIVMLSHCVQNVIELVPPQQRYQKTMQVLFDMRSLDLHDWNNLLLKDHFTIKPHHLVLMHISCFHPHAAKRFFENEEVESARHSASAAFTTWLQGRDPSMGIAQLAQDSLKLDDRTAAELLQSLWNFALTFKEMRREALIATHTAACTALPPKLKLDWEENALERHPSQDDIVTNLVSTSLLDMVDVVHNLAQATGQTNPPLGRRIFLQLARQASAPHRDGLDLFLNALSQKQKLILLLLPDSESDLELKQDFLAALWKSMARENPVMALLAQPYIFMADLRAHWTSAPKQ